METNGFFACRPFPERRPLSRGVRYDGQRPAYFLGIRQGRVALFFHEDSSGIRIASLACMLNPKTMVFLIALAHSAIASVSRADSIIYIDMYATETAANKLLSGSGVSLDYSGSDADAGNRKNFLLIGLNLQNAPLRVALDVKSVPEDGIRVIGPGGFGAAMLTSQGIFPTESDGAVPVIDAGAESRSNREFRPNSGTIVALNQLVSRLGLGFRLTETLNGEPILVLTIDPKTGDLNNSPHIQLAIYSFASGGLLVKTAAGTQVLVLELDQPRISSPKVDDFTAQLGF